MAVAGTSRLGLARLGRFRLGHVPPIYTVTVNGVTRSVLSAIAGDGVRIMGASITDELNHAPNTVRLRCAGFTPSAGHEVKIWCGGVELEYQLFGGHILSLGQAYEAGKPSRVVWDASCIDYTWLLNRRKVIKKYTNQSATAILVDLFSAFASGFTTVHVAAGLPVIDEITFTNEDLPDAVTRVMQRIGGYWFADFNRDIHAFITQTDTADPITTAAPRTMEGIQQQVDLSQVATRVIARGGGSSTAADVAIGQTTLPLVDAADTWYATGGGVVECGQQRITYTGKAAASESGSTTGYIAPPAMSATVTINNGVGSLTTGATYLIGWAYETSEGQTTVANTTAIVATGATPSIVLNGHPVPTDPKVTRKWVFLSSANGNASTLRDPIGGSFPAGYTTQIEILAYVPGGAAPYTTNAAGLSTIATAAGATSLDVEDLAQFPAAGWAEVGGQIFSYTGRSGSSGAGTLTGIPASGIGSLTAAVRGGTVRSIPHLTGVTGIVYAINKGEPVNLIITVNDATAQTNMAAYIGYGDGVHEHFIPDGRWSITEATARANAELTQRKNPLVTVTFNSRDRSIVSGRDITVTLSSPAISGTFKIQRVTLSQIAVSGGLNLIWPLRNVECSSRRYSFEDLLRQIRKGRVDGD